GVGSGSGGSGAGGSGSGGSGRGDSIIDTICRLPDNAVATLLMPDFRRESVMPQVQPRAAGVPLVALAVQETPDCRLQPLAS
ncbi:MAG: hypothetical protein ACXVHJ_34490, partial [Solirubrobacteraceae bacterium]